MIHPQLLTTPTSGMLFDAERLEKPDDSLLDMAAWQMLNKISGRANGRGQVAFIDAPFGQCALRHYQRGGMVAWVTKDRYLWAGAECTRGFREFRLLAHLQHLGLPVPAPIAAHYQRHGWYYRADLLTGYLRNVIPLAKYVAEGSFDTTMAVRVGECVAQFHAFGVFHADLNAHNIVIDAKQVWLLDFDRGKLCTPALIWRRANLMRLQRSMRKLGAVEIYGAAFNALWNNLQQSYQDHFYTLQKTALEQTQTLSQRQRSQ